MLIYNVTTKVEWSIADDWVRWMKEEHIPTVIATGYFIKFQFVKLLESDEEEGPTFAIQYFVPSQNDFDAYIKFHADAFRKEIIEKWGNRFIAFRSLMEVVP